MFVREKRIGAYSYLYLVETVRENGKTKQRIVRNLGRKEMVEAHGDLDRLARSAARLSRRSMILSLIEGGGVPDVSCRRIGAPLLFERLWRDSGCRAMVEELLDLKRRGLAIGPELAVADGALGFWQALEEVWPKARGQRCWVHKTANVLNKLPKSLQPRAKTALHEIWMAETKKDALVALDVFVETYGIKYEKAVECLTKDREALLAFYDFPAEHWKHLRTSNPIESTFATVRHRTVRAKGCLSNKTALAMMFKLAQAAEKSRRRLDGQSQLSKVIFGVKFNDGIEVVTTKIQTAA
jgi:hypothetical protein